MKVLVGLAAIVIICAALQVADRILVPLVFALFIIALVAPLKRRLEAVMPKMVAALITLLLSLAVVGAVTSLVVWGLGHVGQWLFVNASRFQDLYARLGDWLEGHGFLLAGLITEHFDVRWMLRIFQDLSGRLHGLATFLVFTFLYVLLGMLEADAFTSQLRRLRGEGTGANLVAAGTETAAKLQKYMLVRTLMSVGTGAVVWAFTLASGLELALAWGTLAFAFNYIPFIGPFFATLLPTLFALIQFESWQMALFVFASLNVIQFLSGSYLEPRIAGKTLALSPFLVLFSVFFFAFLWGVPGAFIGVPVMLALLTFCAHNPDTRFIADLLSGKPADETAA